MYAGYEAGACARRMGYYLADMALVPLWKNAEMYRKKLKASHMVRFEGIFHQKWCKSTE
jgi:hypothetical protein